MTPAALPADEVQRLGRLHELQLLGSAPDPVLDGLLRCAAELLHYPITTVSLVDADHQWFIARHGMGDTEIPRELSFCAHAILGDGLFEVPDATADPRFTDNPLVVEAPFVRAYAGMPISVRGSRIGTLCLVDHVPHRLTAQQTALLADLAAAVQAWFESRLQHFALQAETARSQARLGLLEKLAMQAPGMLFQYRVAADGRGRFGFVSPQTRALFGLEPEQVDDMHLLVGCAHPDDRAGLRATLAAAGLSGKSWRHDFRVQLPGQAPQWRSARATADPQPDGSVWWHGFVADVTEQAEIEQLRRDKLAAELAIVEKSNFLSRVSHELRTPLNAMLGFTQLLLVDRDEPLRERQRERLDHAHRAAQLLLVLINDLLDVNRIEHGARDLVLGPVAVRALVTECLPMVAQMAEAADVRISITAPGEAADVSVTADRRALEQVLLNLLSNGIKYNRRGGHLGITLRTQATRAFIEVHDQGAGLNASQQARLFQPFERLGAEHSQVEGSGLGLVISRQLVNAMGGRIGVDSAPGNGSTFTVDLPLHASSPPAASPAQAQGPAAASAPLPGPDFSVSLPTDEVSLLYIEDDPVNVILMQEALRMRPEWRLVHAADGHSGLALAQALRPNLVLTDINLPGLSGHDIVRALRLDPRIRHTVCIALSADAMSEQVAVAMRAGFDDYWTKPLDVSAIAGRIESWLAHGASRNTELTAQTR